MGWNASAMRVVCMAAFGLITRSAPSAAAPSPARRGGEGLRAEANWRRLVPGGTESAAAESGGSAPIARSSHELSLVGGKVLLFGGEHTARVPIDAHVWALEQTAGGKWAWEKLATHGEAPTPRIGHAQAAMDTRLFVMGGRQGVTMDEAPLNDLFCLDTATCAWQCITPAPGSGPPPSARSYHRMVRSLGYSTLASCGHPLPLGARVERMHARAVRMKGASELSAATQVAAGPFLYVFGGCPASGRAADLHCFDTRSRQWTSLPAADIPGRGGAGFVALDSGNLAVRARLLAFRA